jgi:TRAP-type C4-dicarboxylate transport system permease small subunit
MQNRTVGIVITVVTALCCVCFAVMSCIWGGMIASGTPFNTSVNGVDTGQQTFPVPVGIGLICLSIIFIIIPIAVGFFTLRKKPAPAPVAPNINEPLPPAS